MAYLPAYWNWTESLLVAAFFAVEKAGIYGTNEVGHAVIYAAQSIPLIDVGAEDPFNLDDIRTYRPPHISPRIPAQNSIFTIQPEPTQPFSHPSLERWVLAGKHLCWEVKRNLDACGINERAVYPDLDGLCRHIAWQYKWAFFNPNAIKA